MNTIPNEGLLIPSNMLKFQCAGCTACCRNKWTIEIDDISYSRLYDRFVETGRLAELKQHISVYPDSQQIRFRPDGSCPFLTSEDLCGIQIELGPEYMPNVCRVYPRKLFQSERGLELSLSCSCKTAAQTLFSEAISLRHIPQSELTENPQLFPLLLPNTLPKFQLGTLPFGDLREDYYAFEDHLLTLLRDPGASLIDSLHTIGRYLLSMLGQKRLPQSNPASIDVCENILQLLNFYLANFPHGNGATIVRSMTLMTCQYPSVPLAAAIKMLQGSFPALSLHETYCRDLAHYFSPSETKLRVPLENYLVNFVLTKEFLYRRPHIAYYKMSFLFTALLFFCVGYSRLTRSAVNHDILLQAITDVENIFTCCTSYWDKVEANFLAELSPREIIQSAIAVLPPLP